MNKLTLKTCLARADELGIEIYGDLGYRGDCPLEDSDLASFFAWVRYNYPQYESLIFHCETEFNPTSASSYAYHTKSKAKGRLDGIADIVCLPVSSGAPAFLCELKRLDISKSLASKKRKEHFETQLLLLSSQKSFGNIPIVALGLEATKTAFKEYINEYGKS
ncbi:hypothetical protein NVP1173O_67 [Vibrio phage 1.173.O._10N.261.55.A11]|nr:hypothetical protein NVP1173O_67 [Vibrio phage 1.173.O._10N.261.55.A11]